MSKATDVPKLKSKSKSVKPELPSVYPLPVLWPADFTDRNGQKDSNLPRTSIPITNTNASLNSHRRSSIPYGGREVRIKFADHVKFLEPDDPAPHKPIMNSSQYQKSLLKTKRSNLKKLKHPILIDQPALKAVIAREKLSTKNTNEDLIYCSALAEATTTTFQAAEKLIRGGVDILTFPVPIQSPRVNELGRLKGLWMLVLDCVKIWIELHGSDLPSNAGLGTSRIIQTLTALVECAKKAKASAKLVKKKCEKEFSRWEDLLKQHGEFQRIGWRVHHNLYKKRMPESVTLFEDVGGIGYLYNGMVLFQRTKEILTFTSESLYVSNYNFDGCLDVDKLTVTSEVIIFSQRMIEAAEKNITAGLETLVDPQLEKDFATIRKRVEDTDYDSAYDPLCARELKNCLGELVEFKSELVNTSERTLDAFRWIVGITKHLLQFCSRKLGEEVPGCCSSKAKSYEDLFDELTESVGFQVDEYEVLMPQSEVMEKTL